MIHKIKKVNIFWTNFFHFCIIFIFYNIFHFIVFTNFYFYTNLSFSIANTAFSRQFPEEIIDDTYKILFCI